MKFLILAGVIALSTQTVYAETPTANDPTPPPFANGFASLFEQLGDRMGVPLEGERPGDEPGSNVQRTTKGLAYWSPKHQPTFFDGETRWIVTHGEVVSWISESLDPPPPEVAPAAPANSVWDLLAECESHGNWAANTGNSFYGGLQFNIGSWQSAGGKGRPDQASRAEQIRIGDNWRAMNGGFGPWPYCSRRLGLPR